MKVRDEIEKYAAPEHKPVLHWLFDRYSWASKWQFVATCTWPKGVAHNSRIWVPTKEGRALYEHAKLHGGEFALPETLPVPEPIPPRELSFSNEQLSATLVMTRDKRSGFWLWDDTRGMNLSMKAKTATAAFVEALTYYQQRLQAVELAHKSLKTKVDAFVGQFTEEDHA